MSVDIPRLNRIEPSAQMPKNDRINMQDRDQGSAILNQTKQVNQVADKYGDIFQAEENAKIEQLADQTQREYAAWTKGELQKLKNFEGDPTDAYKEFDSQAEQKRKELLESRKDLPERVSRHVQSKFSKYAANEQLNIDFQRGAQQETYDNNQFESSVKFKKDQLPKAAGYIPTVGFKPIDDGLADIENTIIQRGLKKGTVVPLADQNAESGFNYVIKDPDGNDVKVRLTDAAKLRIAKEKSEGIKSSVEVLIASGRLDEAKQMQEKYKTYIDPRTAEKLEKKFTAKGKKQEAFSILGGIRTLPEEQQLSKIDSIKDEELRQEVIKFKHAGDQKLSQMRENMSKANYGTLYNHVEQQLKSGAYNGIADLENDPIYDQTWDHLKPTQKKVINEMIQSPKDSNPKALSSAYKLLADPEYLEGADVGDFMEKTAGLSKVDRNRVMKDFQKLTNPSGAEARQVYKRADQLVKKYLVASGEVDADEADVITKQQSKMYEFLSGQKTLPSEDQLQKYAKELAAEDLDAKIFRSKQAPRILGKSSVNQTVTTGAAKSINVDTMDMDKLIDLKNEYARKNNGKLPNKKDPKFIKWLESR